MGERGDEKSFAASRFGAAAVRICAAAVVGRFGVDPDRGLGKRGDAGAEAAAERKIRHGIGWLPAAVSDPAAIPAQLSQLDGYDLPVTVAFAAVDPALIDGYAEAGVQRLVFSVPTLPVSETVHALDGIAEVAERYLI